MIARYCQFSVLLKTPASTDGTARATTSSGKPAITTGAASVPITAVVGGEAQLSFPGALTEGGTHVAALPKTTWIPLTMAGSWWRTKAIHARLLLRLCAVVTRNIETSTGGSVAVEGRSEATSARPEHWQLTLEYARSSSFTAQSLSILDSGAPGFQTDGIHQTDEHHQTALVETSRMKT